MDVLSERPTYDRSRLGKCLDHIRLPRFDGQASALGLENLLQYYNDDEAKAAAELAFLTSLQQNHLAVIPFENLSLHYSSHHSVTLDMQSLYSKIVERGHGGYCMENNCFLGTVLRSLGFKVYSAGARVHVGEGRYEGWSHMVNIVTLNNGSKYMVDVGFGGNGPTKPLLLEDDHETLGIFPGCMRLVQQKIPACTDMGQRLWVYQHQMSPTDEWQPMYCFTEIEFLPKDYEMMNFWTSQSRKCLFTYQIVMVKGVMDEDHHLVGELILTGGEVKRRVKGVTELIKTCTREEERVTALAEIFGVNLTVEETEGIRGMCTELRG